MDSFTPLDNRIIDHWIFQDPEHFKVWFYMIHCAQYSPEEKTDYKYGILCTTGPGDFIFGYESWSRKLNVSVKKLRNLIKKLLAENMIVNQCAKNKFTIYRLVNYEKYRFSGIQKGIVESLQSQGLQDNQGRQEGTRGAGEGQAEGRQRATNKNIEERIDGKEGEDKQIYSRIIDYLNQSTGKNYRASIAENRKLIHARLSDGFTEQDFKDVIDKKVSEWKDDGEYKKYLRPSTLFGNKFESYLNSITRRQPKKPTEEQLELKEPEEGDFFITPEYFDKMVKGLGEYGKPDDPEW